MPQGVRDRFTPTAGLDLCVDVREMAFDGVDADDEVRSGFLVRSPRDNSFKHLYLPWSQDDAAASCSDSAASGEGVARSPSSSGVGSDTARLLRRSQTIRDRIEIRSRAGKAGYELLRTVRRLQLSDCSRRSGVCDRVKALGLFAGRIHVNLAARIGGRRRATRFWCRACSRR